MTTMTCGQPGGPSDAPHRGGSADGVIQAQDRHLVDSVASGGTGHAAAWKGMEGRWKYPIRGVGRYRQARREFAALPES